MIISKTPFRVSFFGGGSDHPIWFNEYGGRVISATINKYCYISCRNLKPFFGNHHRLVYSKIENIKPNQTIKHHSIRAVFNFFKIKEGIELHHDGDLPARTGIGSSSSFTVGLINCIDHIYNLKLSKKKISDYAIHIEQNILRESVGCQDQIAASYGGFNIIDFKSKNKYIVKKQNINSKSILSLQNSLVLCFSGITRISNKIEKKKLEYIKRNNMTMHEMSSITNEAAKMIKGENFDLKLFGSLMKETWKLKNSLYQTVSNHKIDDIYSKGIKSGALGGKLLGAGGGGFILFIVENEKKNYFLKKMNKLICIPINFDSHGTKIIKC